MVLFIYCLYLLSCVAASLMPLFYLVGLALASNLRFKLVDHFYAGWSASDSQFHSSFFFFFFNFLFCFKVFDPKSEI